MGKRQVVEFKSRIEASADDTFKWHSQPGAIDRLIPPWETVEVVREAQGLKDNAVASLLVEMGPCKLSWLARHCETIAGRQFADEQLRGPFAFWRHLHKFEPLSSDTCELIDKIEYELPASPVSELIVGGFVRAKLRRMFEYRHKATAADIRLLKDRGGRVMKVLVTGSHGLVGSHLIPLLTSQGHDVVRLVRSSPGPQEIAWNPSVGQVDVAKLNGFDAVIHLAGDNIATGRWTAAKKAAIRSSRIQGTRLLCDSLARLKEPPSVIISASAIGYYGDRADEVLTENSLPGDGFLADVCREWEAATASATEKGIRVANLRLGMVLSRRGGALAKIMPPFQMGVGGKLGSGKQFMSWVSLDDVVGAIHHVLTHEQIEGPINVVAPNPVTNDQFTADLGAALHRPTMFPVPGFAAHLLLGEMADELLFSSTRVKPVKLLESGYTFRYPELRSMLQQILNAA